MDTNIIDHKQYRRNRKLVENYFKKHDKACRKKGMPIDVLSRHVSPSQKYFLALSRCETKPGCWSYSRGVVTDTSDKVIADIKRNYARFPFLWVAHPNGCEYLVCGEDYQGYTIVNVTKGTSQTYVPEGWLKGVGFCWADHKFDAEKVQLIVDGCFWAAPYEIVTYDFSNPDVIPLPELKREDASYEDDDADDDDDADEDTPDKFNMAGIKKESE
jgi:hypothetical protein